MSTTPKHRYSVEEYLAFEQYSDSKHEYYDGDIFAMAGGSHAHALISGNVHAELRNQLKRVPCTVYPSDLRLKVSPTGLYTYPDVMVVCGEPRLEYLNGETLLNPNLIVEVLSPSTEEYDRTTKFSHYRTLDSFSDYLLVAQDAYLVEHHARQPDGEWVCTEYRGLQAVVPPRSIGCELRLDEVYDKVPINS